MAKLLDGTRIYGTANVDTQVWVGSNVAVNTSAFTVIGNSTTVATMVLARNSLLIGNSSITDQTYINIANSVGNTTINTTSVSTSWGLNTNSTGIYHTGTINVASYTTGSGYGSATGGVTVNSTSIGVGNSTTNTLLSYTAIASGTWFNTNSTGIYHTGVVNAAVHSVGTSFIANTTQLTFTLPLSVNGSLGTNGYVLATNSAGSPYWTNMPPTPRVNTQTTATSLTLDYSLYDQYVITALASTLTFNLSATPAPTNGRKVLIRLKDNGTSQSLTWTTSGTGAFRAVTGSALPAATTTSKITYIGCIYNSDDGFWDVIAVGTQA